MDTKMNVDDIKISGMTCASCAKAVERAVKKLDTSVVASVNIATEKLSISYDEDKVKSEDIEKVIEKAGLKDFVNALPEDLNTVINENGNNISGGEKQRISIARALLKDADLLIYDEPTSNLDHTTAKEIESILLNIDKTCFMITHKLDKELLSKFDEILVLKDGSLKEAGSYQQLVDEGAFFKQLLKGTS